METTTETTVTETVCSLRRKGFKVRVRHNRVPRTISHGKTVYHEKGGQTNIELTAPTGRTVYSVALCSKRENYNRKTGVKLALQRALVQL